MLLLERCALDSSETKANILEPWAARSFFAKSAKEFLIEKAACLPSLCCMSRRMSLTSSFSRNCVLGQLVRVVPTSIQLSVGTMVSIVLLLYSSVVF